MPEQPYNPLLDAINPQGNPVANKATNAMQGSMPENPMDFIKQSLGEDTTQDGNPDNQAAVPGMPHTGSGFIKGVQAGWQQMKAGVTELGANALPYINAGSANPNLIKNNLSGDTQEQVQRMKESADDMRAAAPQGEGFMYELGTFMPQAAGILAATLTAPLTAGTSLSAIPSMIGGANIAVLVGQSMGDAMNSYEDYMIEEGKPVNEAAKWGVGAGAGAAEYLAERIGLNRYLPKGMWAKGITKVLGKQGDEIAQGMFSKMAQSDGFKNLVAKYGWNAIKHAGEEGFEEIATELGQTAIEYMYKDMEDAPGMQEVGERVWKAFQGGAMMGGMISPASTWSQNAMIKKARQQRGYVAIAEDEAGNYFEVLGQEGDKYTVVDAKGKQVDIDEQYIKNVMQFGLNDFDNLMKQAKQGKEVTDQMQQDAEIRFEYDKINSDVQSRIYRGEDFQDLDNDVVVTVDTQDGERWQVLDGAVNEPDPASPMVAINLSTGQRGMISAEQVSKIDAVPAELMMSDLKQEAATRIKARYQQEKQAAKVKDFNPGDIVSINGQDAEIVNNTDPTQGVQVKMTDPSGKEQVVTVPPEQLGMIQPQGGQEQAPVQGEPVQQEAGQPAPAPKRRVIKISDKESLELTQNEDGTSTVGKPFSTLKEAQTKATKLESMFPRQQFAVVDNTDPNDEWAVGQFIIKASPRTTEQQPNIVTNEQDLQGQPTAQAPGQPVSTPQGQPQPEAKGQEVQAAAGSIETPAVANVPASPDAGEPDSKVAGANGLAKPVKPTPTSENKKRKKLLSKEQKEVSSKTYFTPRDIAMQHFATGGMIHPDALFSLFGTRGKENDPQVKARVESERKPRFFWTSRVNGLSIDGIAHRLWEQNPDMGFTTEDFREAVEDVINSYVSPQSMALDLLNVHSEQGQQPNEVELDESVHQEDEQEFQQNVMEILADEELFDVMRVDFIGEDGRVIWDRLQDAVTNNPSYFQGFPFDLSQEQFNNLINIINDEQERQNYDARASEYTGIPYQPESPAAEQDAAGSIQGDVTEQAPAEELTQAQKDVAAKIDKELATLNEKIASTREAKNKKLAELQSRNGLFGDTKDDGNSLFQSEDTFDTSAEAIKKAMEPFDNEIAELERQHEQLKSSRDNSIAAAKNQLSIDERPGFAGQHVDNVIKKEEVKQEEQKVNTDPTEGQKEAGNYQMGHVNVQGLDITIENPKGSVRSGTDSKGNKWQVTMNNTYGYFRGTKGKDGDHVDVFIGENLTSDKVFVVDQVNPVELPKPEDLVDKLVNYKGKDTRITSGPVLKGDIYIYKGVDNVGVTYLYINKEDLHDNYLLNQIKQKPSFDEHKVMLGFNSIEQAREAYLKNYSPGWKGLGDITEVSMDEFKAWAKDKSQTTKPFAEYKKSEPGIKQEPAKPKTAGEKLEQMLAENDKPAKQPDKRIVSDERMEELRKRMKAKLNNLNAGFDPEMMAIGVEMAAYHIESGARKFKAYAKAMIDDLGDKIKPYLKGFYKGAKMMPGMEAYEHEMDTDQYVTDYKFESQPEFAGQKLDVIVNGTSKDKFIGSIKKMIASNEKIANTPQLTSLATAAGFVHGVDYTDIKELYDIASFALNEYFSDNASQFNPSGKTASEIQAIIEVLDAKMNLLATETTRSAEQVSKQQFSTPPAFAFIVNWIARVNKGDTVLEPSAGEGNIAIFAKNTGARVIVNEIDSNRGDLLKRLFSTVLKEDAKHVHALNALKDVKVTKVVMNPPFSRDIALGDKLDIHAAEKHMEAALSKLEDGGRLVAIVGRGMSMDSPTHRAWFDKISQKYTVRVNILVSGEGYSKKGTNFDNRLLIIDKKQGVSGATLTGTASSYGELLKTLSDYNELDNLFDVVSNIKKSENENNNGTSGQTKAGNPANTTVQGGQQPGTTNVVSPGGNKSKPAGQAKNGGLFGDVEPAVTPKGGEVSSTNAGTSGSTSPATNAGANGRPVNIPAPSRGDEPTNGKLPDNGASELVISRKDKNTDNGSDVGYDSYRPEIIVEGAKSHPTKLVESTAMASVSLPEVDYKPLLPQEIVTKGALSDAQLEDIILAGNSHSQMLVGGLRRGFFLGAGTGYGKGRTIAGIILDNWNHGRKKAVWISKNDKAHYDSADYWKSVGGDPDVIFEQKSATAKIAPKEGVLLTKYGTISNKFDRRADYSSNTSFWSEQPQNRLQQIAQWLGKDFDGIVIFDESHKMANAKDSRGTRGMKKASNMALAGLELQRMLPNARIVYSSATGATEVTNLVYAQRLGLWGDGTPFGGPDDFITTIENSGVAGMELISRDLKAMGLYTAKTLSFDGVAYETITHQLMPEQKNLYDKVARAWQTVLKNINDAIEDNNAGKNAKSAAMSAFWGAHQRFFSNIIITMQMPTLLNDIQNSLDQDKAIVVQLVNTNEAATKRALAEAKSQLEEGEEMDYDDMDVSPKQSLLEFLRRSFPVAMFETVTDQNGNEVQIMVRDSNGDPIENPESVRRRDRLIEEIDRELILPEAPLDILLNTFGIDNVAEITGRSSRIVVKTDDKGQARKMEESRTDKHVAADKDAFMDGKKNVLVFSDAGGTGASFHSDLSRKNQKQRVHYVLQAGWKADGAVQGFGRSHRSNQAVAPIFKLVTTDLKAQRRFLSSIARRLDQLGALTKGQRQTGGQGILDGSFNLEGEYAKQALFDFYRDVERGTVQGVTMETLEDQMALKIYKEDENGNRVYNDSVIFNTKMFLNRLMSLEVDLMDAVFDSFMQHLEEQINIAKANGSYDEGIEIVKAEATRVTDEQEIYSDPKTGAKTYITTIELELKNEKDSYEDIMNHMKRYGSKFRGFFKEVNSGRIYAFVAQDIIKADGSRDTKMRRFSVITDAFIEYSDFYGKYEKIDNKDAEVLWESEYNEYPPTRKKVEHIVKGLILPIWNRLPEKISVKRYIDDKGNAHLGRYFSKNDIQEIRKNFEVATKYSYSVDQLISVLDAGGSVRLSNGFELNKTKHQGNIVFKISGTNPYRDRERLVRAGASFVVKSSISMSGDYHIARASAKDVISSILELYNADAVEVEDANGNPVSGQKVEKAAQQPGTFKLSDLAGSRSATIPLPSSQPAQQQPAAPQVDSEDFEVFTQRHTKTGETLYMATPKRRNNDVYSRVLSIAKKHKGSYSSYSNRAQNVRSGFMFTSEAERNAFLSELKTNDIRFRQYFYSPTEKALSQIKQERGTVEQFKAMLLKNGAKQAEMDWMGFDEAFSGQKMINKADVQKWIDLNRVQLEEVVKSDSAYNEGIKELEREKDKANERLNEIKNELDATALYVSGLPLRWMYKKEDNSRHDVPEQYIEEINDLQVPIQDYEEAVNDAEYDTNLTGASTKYYDYKTPGGENYTEWLMTVPSSPQISFEQWNENRKSWDKEPGTFEEYKKMSPGAKDFNSSHWDESNVVVHVRSQEFTDTEGKRVLLVEEIQSDWAQVGKKKGFKTKPLPTDKNFIAYRKELHTKYGTSSIDDLKKKATSAEMSTLDDLFAKENDGSRLGLITDMPFKQTEQWVGLAMKRMIQHAVDNGFDKIAWTTGSQQAERYDISKQVDTIFHKKNEDGTYHIEATPKGSMEGSEVIGKSIPESELEKYVGKDMAIKIKETPETDDTFGGFYAKEGVDLQIGGSGMKGFYDSIIPAWVSKNWKKYGAKVGTTNIDIIPSITDEGIDIESGDFDESLVDEKYMEVHSVEITPALEQAAEQAQPMFRAEDDYTNDSIVDSYLEKASRYQRYADRARALGRKYGVPIRIITDRKQLPARIQNKMKANRIYPGVYDLSNGNIYVLVNEMSNMNEIELTIAHEIVAHKGLREMLGNEAFDELCENVYYSMSSADRLSVTETYDTTDKREIADEFMARMAETGKFPKFFDRVISAMRQLLRKAGFKARFTDADIMYLLWQSRNRLERNAGLDKYVDYKAREQDVIENVRFSVSLFHGSPHDFDRFTTEKIGTGEGVQAFGWGLYFTSKEGIAMEYARRLSSKVNLPWWDKLFGKSNKNLYKVRVDFNDSQFMRWELPITAKQASLIAREINKTNSKISVEAAYKRLQKPVFDNNYGVQDNSVFKTGAEVYDFLVKVMPSAKNVSMLLDRAGIPGIKYPANFTTGMINGKDFNYVVFDEKAVQVENKIRFRISPSVKPNEPKMVNGKAEEARELVQDKMLSMRNLQHAILKDGGNVPQSADVYSAENRMSSRSKAMIEDYNENQHEHLVNVVAKLTRVYGAKMSDINLYLKAKSSIERNDNEGVKALNEDDNGTWGRNEVTAIVENFEKKVIDADVKELWDAIKDCTDYAIKSLYLGNVISRQAYEAMAKRKYYVPLKSWQAVDEEGNPSDYYDYQQGERTAYQGLRKAKGRGSEADDPLAYIQAAAHTAVVSANRNMMKHKALMLARLNPGREDLLSVKKIYIMEKGEDAEGLPIYKEVIKDGENAYSIDSFTTPGEPVLVDEGNFAELYKEGVIKRRITREHLSRRPKYLAAQHQVEVMENGEKYIISFGDPNVANAINGANTWQPKVTEFVQKYFGWLTRILSSNFTAKNPAFIPYNWIRDFGYAVTAHSIREDGNLREFINAYPDAIKAIHRHIAGNANPGTNHVDELYKAFREFGGETGYIHMKDIKKLKTDIQRDVNRKLGIYKGWDSIGQRKLLKASGHMLEYLALMSENSARFATFVASVNQGKSYEQSATDAKNITVNFNRKGRISGTAGAIYAFFNATVQGGHNIMHVAKNNKKNFAIGGAAFIAAGMMLAELLRAVGPRDEEGNSEYDKLPLWVRQTCIVIPSFWGEGFITIPLPQGFRSLYALGVTASDAMHGKVTAQEATFDIISSVTEAFSPFAFNDIEVREGRVPIRPFIPTGLVPVYDAVVNEDFSGRQIHKVPFTEAMKRYTPKTELGAKNVNGIIKGFTDLMNTIGGGDKERQAGYVIDKTTGEITHSGIRDMLFNWNPSSVEHTLEYYLGGRGKFFNQLYKTAKAAVKPDEDVQGYNIPVVNRLYREPYEGNHWQEYFDIKNQVRDYEHFSSVASKSGDIDKIMTLTNNTDMMVISNMLKTYDKAISSLTDLIPLIEDRQELEEIREQRDELIKEFMREVTSVKDKENKPIITTSK